MDLPGEREAMQDPPCNCCNEPSDTWVCYDNQLIYLCWWDYDYLVRDWKNRDGEEGQGGDIF